jgi:hypothetical protein
VLLKLVDMPRTQVGLVNHPVKKTTANTFGKVIRGFFGVADEATPMLAAA